MRYLTVAAMCAALTAGLAAHPNVRIIGTVTKVTADRLDVKQTRDGAIISMEMDGETKFTRDKKPVPRAEVKVGRHVVVDACGDSLKELLVMEVKLVPAPATKK